MVFLSYGVSFSRCLESSQGNLVHVGFKTGDIIGDNQFSGTESSKFCIQNVHVGMI